MKILDGKALSGWQTKRDEVENVILTFEQEKIVQQHSWKMFFIYATQMFCAALERNWCPRSMESLGLLLKSPVGNVFACYELV